MGEQSDAIRQEIDHTRDNAAAKIDQIQTQVHDTQDQVRQQVHDTTQQVQDTAHQVREQVQGTVEDTVESVKQGVESIDFNQQVQQRPLMAVGAAFIGGIVLGKLTSSSGSGGHSHGGGGSYAQHQQYDASGGQNQYAHHNGHGGHGVGESLRGAVQKSGLDDTISNAAAALMGSFTEQLRSTMDQKFPGFADRLQSAQHSEGSVIDKAKATVDSGTTSASSSPE